jgi:hypothetical protein
MHWAKYDRMCGFGCWGGGTAAGPTVVTKSAAAAAAAAAAAVMLGALASSVSTISWPGCGVLLTAN